MTVRHPIALRIGAAIATLALGTLAGCGATGASSARKTEPAAAAGSPSSITVDTCGKQLTLAAPPKRVVFINAIGVSVMHELDVLDRSIGRAGTIDTSVFDDKARAAIERVPKLAGTDTGSGHISVATETLIESKPDLVIGFNSAIDGAKLDAAKIPFYVPQAYCAKRPAGDITFDAIHHEVTALGTLFGVSDRAEKINAELTKRLEAVTKAHAGAAPRSAAAIYVTPGDSKLSAYGSKGMAHPLLGSVGMKNVYGDREERAFDVSTEDLLEKNPDVVLLLNSTGTEQETLSTFTKTGGLAALKAVRERRVYVVPYTLVDPPSPLSVTGTERFAKAIKS